MLRTPLSRHLLAGASFAAAVVARVRLPLDYVRLNVSAVRRS